MAVYGPVEELHQIAAIAEVVSGPPSGSSSALPSLRDYSFSCPLTEPAYSPTSINLGTNQFPYSDGALFIFLLHG